MKKNVLAFAAMFILSIECHAQNRQQITNGALDFELSGKIIDKANAETLPYASVLLKKSKIGATTNSDGFFTLLHVPTDTDTLLVQYVGYQTMEVPIKSLVGQSIVVIELNVSEQILSEVVVTSNQLDNQMIVTNEKISQISISPAALKSLPSMGEQDIFRSIQLLPGVSGTNEASSGLFVRGGTPDQNLILLDGFTVYHVDHFYGFFSAFNPNAIKDVQLYKGGFEAKYGGRLSSVMELTGKTGNQKRVSGGAGLGAISANAYLEIPFGDKVNLFLAGRRSYTDIVQSGVYNSIFDLYNNQSNSTVQTSNVPARPNRRNQQQQNTEPSFFFYDLNAKLSYRPSAKDIVSLSFYSGKDDLDNSRVQDNTFDTDRGERISINSQINDLLQWGNLGASARWARQWNSRYFSTVTASYSNYFSDRDRLNRTNVTRADSTINRVTGDVEKNNLLDYTFAFTNQYRLNERHTLEFGLQTTINDIAYQFTRNDTLNLIDEQNNGVLVATYLQDTWRATDKLSIIGGIRASYYDVTAESYYEPRLSASYQLTPKIRLKAAWGRYHQFVNRIVREDISQGSRDFWLLADNQNSPVSFSRHLIGGVSYETNGWLLDVEVYDKSLDGLVEYSNRQSAQRLADLENTDFFFRGTGVARGAEFLIQKKTGRYKGWLSYTLGEVVHTIPGISDNPYYATNDTRHEVKLVNTYQIGKWDFGLTWVYGTGKPYTAPYGEYDLNTLDGDTFNYISVGAKNAFRLPDYHRMDLSINYTMKLGKANGQVGISFFNLYNRENVWYKEFLVEEQSVIETNVNLIGFTPNLNVSIKF